MLPTIVTATHKLNVTTDEQEAIKLIADNALPWEAVPGQWRASVQVWKEVLKTMPANALIRNLGQLTSKGILTRMSDETQFVIKRLSSSDYITRNRVHPITIFEASKVYAQGHGDKGKLTWKVVPNILQALDTAFYLAFPNIEPINKRIHVAIDVSGSMAGATALGMPNLSVREAAAAMAMVFARESRVHFSGFDSEYHALKITAKMQLDAVIRMIERIQGGATKGSVPIEHSLSNNEVVDAFIILTDNEVWVGQSHVNQALARYRRIINQNAKLVVLAFSPSRSSVGDPKDPNSIDIVGLDSAVPTLVSSFLK